MTVTQARLKELLFYDPDTGDFTWKKRMSNRAMSGARAGCFCKYHGYVFIRLDGVLYRGHRLAWLYMHGRWPEPEIDHRDRNRSNNAIGNLREASRAQNLQNVIKSKGKSGLRGVGSRRNGRHQARITVDGVEKSLGWFPDAESAHAAYLAAKAIHHPYRPSK